MSELCRVLSVSRGGYYDWLARGESQRSGRDRELIERIREVHQASHEAYGAVKTWLDLRARGIACGKHRVARLRRRAGIEARRKRRFRVIVEHHHTAPAAPNLVKRQFHTSQPDRIWVGDMTFIRTRAGFLHVAVLIDLYSRRVVGSAMGAQPQPGARKERACHSAAATATAKRARPPHRSGTALHRAALPGRTGRARDAPEHERQGQCLR